MKGRLELTPVRMTEAVMDSLEKAGCITRLTPSRAAHRVDVLRGEGRGEYLYESAPATGTHALMSVAIDNETFSSFATHPDNEEFLLLGGADERPMYLLVCLLRREALIEALARGEVKSEHFVLLDVVFNDPAVSFFVMRANVPHGECAYGAGRPSTFYVTEGSALTLDKIDLYRDYSITITERS